MMNQKINGEVLRTITLVLFNKRFKDDVKKDGSLQEFASSYFEEWVGRMGKGLAYALSCADNETKQAINEIESGLNMMNLTLGGVEQ